MKHYVLGFVFNRDLDQILLIRKNKPKWQKGRWNGIGGKIEKDETPEDAMHRECLEETGMDLLFRLHVIFVCPGGTVYVFACFASMQTLPYRQIEKEELDCWPVVSLPLIIMANLLWIIPLCLADLSKPILIHQNTLGVDNGQG